MVKATMRGGVIKMNRLLVLVLTIILSIISTSGYAAEELFDTKTAEKHIEQGIAYLKAKNFDAAISEFDEASVILPDAEAYYFLGYAYYLKGRSGDADSRKKSMESFEKAYEIDPNFSPTRFKPAETDMMGAQQAPKQEEATSPASAQTATQAQPSQPAQPQPEQQAQPAQPAPPAEQPKP
jgi:tetratricopeptide (TPR) repeat protein